MSSHLGKGKGQGRPTGKTLMNPASQWPEPPPGLTKFKPLKKNKVQQEATELLASTWTVLPENIQNKLQALGIGPNKPEEPELTDLLKTHMAHLLRAPIPHR